MFSLSLILSPFPYHVFSHMIFFTLSNPQDTANESFNGEKAKLVQGAEKREFLVKKLY